MFVLRKPRGFTIIEALIAVVVLIGIILALLGILPKVFQDASHDAVRTQAATAAQQYLDSLHQYVAAYGTNAGLPLAPVVAIDQGDTYLGSAPITSAGPFQLSNNGCPPAAAAALMFDCQVTARWAENGDTFTLTLESYVTSQK